MISLEEHSNGKMNYLKKKFLLKRNDFRADKQVLIL